MSFTLSVNNLLIDLIRIYRDVYHYNNAIIQQHVDYYDSIAFIILHKDNYFNIILQISEAIDIENIDNLNEWSYALV